MQAFLLLATLVVSSPVHSPSGPAVQRNPTPPIEGYRLVWRDEFSGKRIDSKKWKPWAIGKRRDAINVADAAVLDGKGHLVISTRLIALPNGKTEVQTGGVWSQGLFEPKYGYIEAKIQFQTQVGHWGAFWLNSGGMGNPVGDPAKAGVEIDVVEFHHKMLEGHEVQHNVHWDGYGADHKSKGAKVAVSDPASAFHTYGVLWEPDRMAFYVDGKESWRWDASSGAPISARPEHMILSLEVGDWAGSIQQAHLPDSMIVDYVRVWQRKP